MKTIVSITSILSLIIAVGFMIFLYLKYLNNQKTKYPHSQNEKENFEHPECPDFFEIVTDSNGEKQCKNIYKIGKCRKTAPYTVSFRNNKLFNNTKDGNYWKCRWAKDCEVPWDGIDQMC
tara:strand:- start:758 stop:1117 length:360 start_codon:yes stop_codon:yes gene_type:complete